jgi:hypothetical protein
MRGSVDSAALPDSRACEITPLSIDLFYTKDA